MSEDIVGVLSCSPVIDHNCPDPSSIVNYFSQVLQHSLDRHPPYVTRTMLRRSAPWITADIKKLCKERDVLYKRARRLGSDGLLMQYRTKRRELKELMLSSRQTHLRHELASTSDSARIWRILRKEGLTVNKNNLNCNNYMKILTLRVGFWVEKRLKNNLKRYKNRFGQKSVSSSLNLRNSCVTLENSLFRMFSARPIAYL